MLQVALAADDIRSAIWERTIRDVAHGALGALTLQSLGEMANDPSSIQLAHRVTGVHTHLFPPQ